MSSDTNSAPRPPSRQRHREVLVVAIGVVILAFLMEVRDDQRVSFRGCPSYPAPELCMTRTWFGTKCPGCGLTRGMIYLARADWPAAFEVHRLSGILAFAILLQIPYRIYCLRTGRIPFGARLPRLFGHFLIASLLINWIIGLAIERPNPVQAYERASSRLP